MQVASIQIIKQGISILKRKTILIQKYTHKLHLQVVTYQKAN